MGRSSWVIGSTRNTRPSPGPVSGICGEKTSELDERSAAVQFKSPFRTSRCDFTFPNHDRRMTLTELADRIGMGLANLSILKTGKARAIRFSTLDAICEALSCQPGDILRF